MTIIHIEEQANTPARIENVVTMDGGLDWILDLLITLPHDSEVEVITAPSLISTLNKSPQHTLSLFQPAVSSLDVS
jgi:hypothetical protein